MATEPLLRTLGYLHAKGPMTTNELHQAMVGDGLLDNQQRQTLYARLRRLEREGLVGYAKHPASTGVLWWAIPSPSDHRRQDKASQ